MRYPGFALLALMVGITAAWAQQPGAPGGVPPTPGVPPPLPPAVAPADQKLDGHLAAWEKKMADVKNFRFELELERKDPAAAGVFKNEKKYVGVVLGLKPNYAILRLDYEADLNNKELKRKDYEAFICDGKAVYAYSGLSQTITKHKLPDPKTNPAGATGSLILDFVSGMKSKELKERFEINLFNETEHYIYLEIKPILGKDKEEFKQLKLALFGPKTAFAYLPAQVYMVKPNDTTEQWKLKNPQTDIQGIGPQHFKYEDVPGFTVQEAPQQPVNAVRPGVPTPPPGGAVRPGVPTPGRP